MNPLHALHQLHGLFSLGKWMFKKRPKYYETLKAYYADQTLFEEKVVHPMPAADQKAQPMTNRR